MHIASLTRAGLCAAVLSLGLLAIPASSWATDAAPANAAQIAAPETDAELEALLERVESKYRDVKSIYATFVQTVRSDVFGDLVEKGDIWLGRPAKMRWSFKTGQMFVANGEKAWAVAPDGDVTEIEDIGKSRSTADTLLSSLDKLTELFHVQRVDAKVGHHALKLTPKREDAQGSILTLSLTDELVLAGLVVTTADGRATEMSFADVKLNAPVTDELFTLSAPRG